MIRVLLVISLIVLVLNVVYVFGSPVMKNIMLEGKMRDLASNRAAKPEAAIRRDLMVFVYDKDIAIDPEQIVIQLNNSRMTIAGHYRPRVSYWFYTHEYTFFPASEKGARLNPRRTASSRGRLGG